MTVELITGFAGTPHIGSDDIGAFQAGIVGPGDYALATGNQLRATMSNANTIAVQSGDAVLNGRHVHLTGTTTATVQSGTQGQKRNDLVVLRYTKNTTTGVETCSIVVLKGTPTTGTPADPAHNTGSILDGVATHDMPLYRIPINGITVGTLVPLFNALKPMKDVWDSLTQRIRFDRSGTTSAGDEMYLNGAILPGSPDIAVISIVWFNKGAFQSQSWQGTVLARMVGWKVIGAAVHSPAAENIDYNTLGKNQFAVTRSGEIQYVTPGPINIPENGWHRGCLIAPVMPA